MPLRKLFIILYTLLMPLLTFSMAPKKLSQINYHAASLLPYSINEKTGERIFLLAREAHGHNKGTWDAFGGHKDAKEWHPDQTAAREATEETARLLFTNAHDAHEYIAVRPHGHNNTKLVIARESKHGVIFVTEFTYDTLKWFTKQFYPARAKAKKSEEKEKDKLAFVKESDLKAAILAGKYGTPTTVQAQVVKTDGSRESKQIILRPIFATMLRPYYQNKPYTPGNKPQIRIYN